MILVGFAESVSDSSSFEHCFDSCVDSQQLFGFNCTSGMYYFEESQLNCILNSEDRHSQSDLFAEENTDIVDYFEVGCDRPRAMGVTIKKLKDSSTIKAENLVIANETQTAWSKCENNLQHRRRDCKDITNCGLESRKCLEETGRPTKDEIADVKERLRAEGFHCQLNTCCKVFKGCQVGLMHNSKTKRLEYCKNPCEKNRKKLKRRRHRQM